MLDPEESGVLYASSLHNLALYLYESQDHSRYPEADACLDRAARLFYGKSICVEMAKTCWIRGMIKGYLGDRRARRLLEKASHGPRRRDRCSLRLDPRASGARRFASDPLLSAACRQIVG